MIFQLMYFVIKHTICTSKYISKYNYPDKCDFVLLSKGELTHYVWIKDFNRFMYNKKKLKGKKHFCKSCLHCFSQESILMEHIQNCLLHVINDGQSVKMPRKGSKVFFRNRCKQLMVPFIIYADFEAITERNTI